MCNVQYCENFHKTQRHERHFLSSALIFYSQSSIREAAIIGPDDQPTSFLDSFNGPRKLFLSSKVVLLPGRGMKSSKVI